jgi:type IV pilus modification protein PilV
MRNTRPDQGFTMLEVMIAVLIMSFGILGVATLLTNSLNADGQTQSLRNAEAVALEVIEDLKAQSVNKTSTELQDDINKGLNQLQYRGLRFRWQLFQHTANTKSDPSGLWRIDMTVGWGKCTDEFDPTSCKRTTVISNFLQPKTE